MNAVTPSRTSAVVKSHRWAILSSSMIDSNAGPRLAFRFALIACKTSGGPSARRRAKAATSAANRAEQRVVHARPIAQRFLGARPLLARYARSAIHLDRSPKGA